MSETSWKEWKKAHRNYSTKELVKWTKEAVIRVRNREGWVIHEDYRRAVNPTILQNYLEYVVSLEGELEIMKREQQSCLDGTPPNDPPP